MSKKPIPWSNTDKLEDVFMSAGDGDEAGVETLALSLENAAPVQIEDWSPALREAWEVGAELAMEAMDRQNLRAADVRLLEALSAVGFDTPIFRDLLAVAARHEFRDYLDPAGLLQALSCPAGPRRRSGLSCQSERSRVGLPRPHSTDSS